MNCKGAKGDAGELDECTERGLAPLGVWRRTLGEVRFGSGVFGGPSRLGRSGRGSSVLFPSVEALIHSVLSSLDSVLRVFGQ